jgi:hypothetical protein
MVNISTNINKTNDHLASQLTEYRKDRNIRVSVIDCNISLIRTASRSNYAIIDYTMLQSASIVIFKNGIFHWPLSKAY